MYLQKYFLKFILTNLVYSENDDTWEVCDLEPSSHSSYPSPHVWVSFPFLFFTYLSQPCFLLIFRTSQYALRAQYRRLLPQSQAVCCRPVSCCLWSQKRRILQSFSIASEASQRRRQPLFREAYEWIFQKKLAFCFFSLRRAFSVFIKSQV